ncbi:MAG: hypothetical protein EOM12_03350 [Verrucomicrobiae bacterium]|nr:hypothetical protein [Verrucomicrobiae bacterium]
MNKMKKISAVLLAAVVTFCVIAVCHAEVWTNTVDKYLPSERVHYRTWQTFDQLDKRIADQPTVSYYVLSLATAGTNTLTTDYAIPVGDIITDAFVWPTAASTGAAVSVSLGVNTLVDLLADTYASNGLQTANTCLQCIPDRGTAAQHVVLTNATVTSVVTGNDQSFAGYLVIESMPAGQ